MSDKNVRSAWSEPADPFGDAAFADTGADSVRTAAAHTPDLAGMGQVPLGFEPEPSPGASKAAPKAIWSIRGFLAFGVARVIIGLVFFAVTSGGFSFFTNLGDDGPPNVPQHVLDACSQALFEEDQSAEIGSAIAFDQAGSDSLVTFLTPYGEEWSCRWTPQTKTATVEPILS